MPSVDTLYTAYIRTTPESLWAALTSPSLTRRYFDFSEGFMRVESDWSPGSAVRYRAADGKAQIEGEVVAVEPPNSLTTTLSLRYSPGARDEPPSSLTWHIIRMGEVCRLTVEHRHTGDAPATAVEVSIFMPSILSNLTVLLETGRPRLVKAIVVDCRSPATLAAFWAAVTGYVLQGPAPTEEDDFVGLADPNGVDPELGFQRVPERKSAKNRLHLDLHVTDLDGEVTRLTDLGARLAPGFPRYETLAVMLDPEGNEFCLTGEP